jgi:hypothetical protein
MGREQLIIKAIVCTALDQRSSKEDFPGQEFMSEKRNLWTFPSFTSYQKTF